MNKYATILMTFSILFSNYLSGQNIPPTKHPKSKKWEDLIAKDFSNVNNPGNVWSFQGDILTASEDRNIWTHKEYDNFIIDLQFKTAEGTNSGVIVYCSDTSEWVPNSVEIQIADDYAKKWAESPKTWQCGAIFGHLAATESAVKKPGKWNRYTITCQDKMIYVMLNKKLVATMNMDLWTSAKTNPDGSEIPAWLSTPFNQLPTKGSVGLQGKHAGAPIYFRRLKIREIN